DHAVLGLELDNVVFVDAEHARGLGMNLGPTVPDDLSDRLGQFLQPWLVRAAPAVKKNMRIRIDRKPRGIWRRGRLERRGTQPERRNVLFFEKSAFALYVYKPIIRGCFRICFDRFGSQRKP